MLKKRLVSEWRENNEQAGRRTKPQEVLFKDRHGTVAVMYFILFLCCCSYTGQKNTKGFPNNSFWTTGCNFGSSSSSSQMPIQSLQRDKDTDECSSWLKLGRNWWVKLPVENMKQWYFSWHPQFSWPSQGYRNDVAVLISQSDKMSPGRAPELLYLVRVNFLSSVICICLPYHQS